jgi:hypothetical protein
MTTNVKITLSIGDVAKTPIGTNYYTGKHRYYAVPYEHIIHGYSSDHDRFEIKNLGVILRITQEELRIVTNTAYNGHAVTCFLDKRYKGMVVLSVKITKINQHSVCGEPVEWIKLIKPMDKLDSFDDMAIFTGNDINKDFIKLQENGYNPIWHNKEPEPVKENKRIQPTKLIKQPYISGGRVSCYPYGTHGIPKYRPVDDCRICRRRKECFD